MFFRQNILEKLIKEAYKGGGLHIAHTLSDTDEPIYVIGGSWWVIWVGAEWLTKETKAAIHSNSMVPVTRVAIGGINE